MVSMNNPALPARGVVEGIRIVDFSQFAAGPWCTSFLGDLGADIIKVERPGRGDPSRGSRSDAGRKGQRFGLHADRR